MNKIHESIVLVGGGGGVYRLARFLKNIRSKITTIQTMFDRGSHSGQLRDERGVLPPGDIRQAILALSDDSMELPLRALLSYRFPCMKSAIDNATMGNLMLTALTDICGGPIAAIEAMSKIFGVKGRVLPVSLDHADLCAKLSDGSVIKGEGLIDTRSPEDDRQIASVFLEPEANIFTGAFEAIVSADKIIFCPGDLYTSIIPNVLTTGFREAIAESSAKLIYVVNLMTKKAETHNFSASKFVSTLLLYLDHENFDVVICNDATITEKVRSRYKEEQAEPVFVDKENLWKYSKEVITGDIADQAGGVLRHSSEVSSIIARL